MCKFKFGVNVFLFSASAALISILNPARLAAQTAAQDMPGGEYSPFDFYFPGAVGTVSSGGIEIGIFDKTLHDFNFQTIWTPPDNCSISESKQKTGSNAITIYVLTSCGNFYVVTISGGNGLYVAKAEQVSPLPGLDNFGDFAGDDLYCTSGNKVFVTHDNQTWLIDTTGLNGSQIQGVVLDTTLNVFVGTSTGVFKQPPNGTTWTALAGSPKNITSFFVSREDNIEAWGYGGGPFSIGGPYKSIDHGATWSLDTAGMGNQTPGKMSEDAKGNIYAITHGSNTADQIWKQSASAPWQAVFTNFPVLGDGINSYVLTDIRVDTFVLMATAFGQYLSTDNGATWRADNNGISAADIYAFYTYPNDRRVITTSLGLYIKAHSDTAWTKTFPKNFFQSEIKFDIDNVGTLYAENGFIYGNPFFDISTDNGSTWVADTIGLSQYNNGAQFVDESGAEHLATFQYNGAMHLWVKVHGGAWQGDSSGYTVASGDQPVTFASDHHGSIYLSVSNSISGNRLFSRPIGGGAWTEFPATPMGGVPTNFTATKDGKLVAGGNSMRSGYYDGSKWTLISDPPEASGLSGHPASVDSMNRLWSIYGSVDQNSNFTPHGVYWTSDLGQHWTQATDASYNFSSLVASADSTYGLTYGNGLINLSAPASSGSVASNASAHVDISIVPNPSSDKVTIEMPNARSMVVEVFDELGNIVASTKGRAFVVWNGNDESGNGVASGIYIVRVSGTDNSGQPFLTSKQLVIQH